MTYLNKQLLMRKPLSENILNSNKTRFLVSRMRFKNSTSRTADTSMKQRQSRPLNNPNVSPTTSCDKR